jgi:hypothetical protein
MDARASYLAASICFRSQPLRYAAYATAAVWLALLLCLTFPA